MSRYYDVEVVRIEPLTQHAWRVDVRRVDGEAFTFRAGQFLMMWFEHEGQRKNRSYSVAGELAPGVSAETLELCIALVDGGIGSQIVAQWEVGSTFTVSGPHGRFMLRDGEASDLVLVGTGTGIAPYRSMKPQLEAALSAGRRVDLIFGARDEAQFLYGAEWRELAARFEHFTYWRCADEAADPDAWAADGGVVGRVQVALDAIAERSADSVYYLCGNPAMVEDVCARLLAAGVERAAIRREAYVSPVM